MAVINRGRTGNWIMPSSGCSRERRSCCSDPQRVQPGLTEPRLCKHQQQPGLRWAAMLEWFIPTVSKLYVTWVKNLKVKTTKEKLRSGAKQIWILRKTDGILGFVKFWGWSEKFPIKVKILTLKSKFFLLFSVAPIFTKTTLNLT